MIVCFISILSVHAIGEIITVDLAGGGDHETIHAAVTAASAGDTILVMSGQYDFTVALGMITVSKKLYIIGSGYDKVEDGGTKIYDVGGSGLFTFDNNAKGSVIKGFRMETGATAISVTANSTTITVEENFIYAATTVNFSSSQRDTIRSNILVSPNSVNVRINSTSGDFISNNLIVGGGGNWTNRMGIYCVSATGLIIANNIIMKAGDQSSGYGAIYITSCNPDVYSNIFIDNYYSIAVSSASPYITNNLFYNNTANGWGVGQNAVEADPKFVNFTPGSTYDKDSPDNDEYDFHLGSGSPAINAGRVGLSYNDTDGTQNDIGMYGGPWPFMNDLGIPTIPEVISISVTPATVSPSGTITVSATGRIGAGGGAKSASEPGIIPEKANNKTDR